jgi:hypothetical protein
MLRKRYLRSKFQHRILEFEIFNNDKITKIGRIYSFSTDSERTEYGHAVAMKSILLLIYLMYLFISNCLVPQEMKVEIKATLLIAALLLVCRFFIENFVVVREFFFLRNHDSINQLLLLWRI